MKTIYNLRFIFIYLSVVFLSSCSDNFLFPRPSAKEFEKVFAKPYGGTNSKLLTKGFYSNNTLSPQDSLFFNYLSFTSSGNVFYFSNTSMQPNEYRDLEIYNVEVNKKGIPKNKHQDFGFYKIVGDSIIAMVHFVGLLGSWDYYKINGLIGDEMITVNIKKLGIGVNTEKWKYEDLVFEFNESK